MKFRSLLLTTLAVLVMMGTLQARSQTKKVQKKQKTEVIKLFNGKNLDNWAFFLRDNSVEPSKVFSVNDGVIRISGQPFGYMRTKDIYSDYRLTLEWRWPSEPTNSGVFIHAQVPDTIWPKCFEVQLKAGSAGDFVCMNGSDMNERTDKSVRVLKKMAESSEKNPGDWNRMEVNCTGNSIEVYINGILQNKATGTNVSSGHICLQSEGKDLEFRNVSLKKAKKQKS